MRQRSQRLIGAHAQHRRQQRPAGRAAHAPAKHEQQRHPDQHGVNHVVAQQARHHARKHAHCHAARTKAARLHIFQRVGDEHREERRKQHVLGKIAGEHRMIRAEGENAAAIRAALREQAREIDAQTSAKQIDTSVI